MPKLSRYQANCLIIAKLQRLIDKYPDQRFQQILQNLGISSRFGEDRWYEESEDTLETISRFEETLK